MKRLILFRHGKSDWHAPHGSDHDRPLNRRGVVAAETMGLLLSRADLVPDHAITSSALRARTTLELARSAGEWQCSIEVSDALYGTTARDAVAVASRTAAEVESLMLVGHEPTWSQVAHHLTGGYVTVKTATVIGIDLPIDSWHHADTRGSLAFLYQPRDFTGWLESEPLSG
jgi:phosphohistidine phosphatase